jgi:hypothetical protein
MAGESPIGVRFPWFFTSNDSITRFIIQMQPPMHQSILTAFCVAVLSITAQAQETPPVVSFSGYVEPYYAYDFHNPKATGNRPGFLYAHNRHNEFNVNLGFLKGQYTGNSIRANAALAVGTYMNANYSSEPGVLKNILEMNAGVRLSKKSDLWLDMGIFGSHIGFESAVGKDCRTLTRSMMAENSPYFESGAKLTYNTPDGQWTLAGLVLNGWQRIQRPAGNSLPAFGTQVQYKPNDKILLNSSTFAGSDTPDEARQMRYFHNLYGVFQLAPKWETTLAFDIGWQQDAPESSNYNTWYSAVAMLRYEASNRVALTLRGELYHDKDAVIISIPTLNGFQTAGFSLNMDYAITDQAIWRVEGRVLSSREGIFLNQNTNTFTPTNAVLTTAFAVSF